ncbi:exoc-7 [Pristionchus pacificus]|uniref:Exocyst complex component 7 n=2 Tax=Pristionchus pacificus TaxID=54126 RepID=A0A2A6BSP7_PRIPA|nr:exoc-7 [Pristionchus pacificus]|eukprot:PDM68992.1 exoc-7 [Pristionchus pacificus]
MIKGWASPMSTVEALNKKLQQDEDWLRQFEANVTRSEQLRGNIERILNDFERHIDQLESNVFPMHEQNGKLQIKQMNIQKLLKTIDATIQFYGKSGELESAIRGRKFWYNQRIACFSARTSRKMRARDGSPSLDLGAYLEQMEHLQQAVAFFHAHPNYGTQLDNMKITLESGCVLLEKEYRNVVHANSHAAEPQAVIDCLDEQYELMQSRAREIHTLSNVDKVARLGEWLLKHGRSSRFLQHYSSIRGDLMVRTLTTIFQAHSMQAITDKIAGLSASANTSFTRSNASFNSKNISTTSLKKATRFAPDQGMGTREAEGADTECGLLVTAAFVALVYVEEGILDRAVPVFERRAQVHRDLLKAPLNYVIKVLTRSVQESEGSLAALLPLLRFVAARHVQLSTIAENAHLEQPYQSAFRALTLRCSSYIADYFERGAVGKIGFCGVAAALRTTFERGAGTEVKFVPSDGNVHPVTASTLNTLYLLSHYRQVVTNQVLSLNAQPNEPVALLMPKLFAKMLSHLGHVLRARAETYDDPTLAAIFSLNNSNYIAKALGDESSGLLPVLREQNAHILQFYLDAIQKHISEYMASWYPVLQTITSVDQMHPEDRTAMRNAITAFTREFEQTVSAQRGYCVTDPILADQVRVKVKAAVVPMYAKLYNKANALTEAASLSSHLRYTEESLDVNIDRLFDVAV